MQWRRRPGCEFVRASSFVRDLSSFVRDFARQIVSGRNAANCCCCCCCAAVAAEPWRTAHPNVAEWRIQDCNGDEDRIVRHVGFRIVRHVGFHHHGAQRRIDFQIDIVHRRNDPC